VLIQFAPSQNATANISVSASSQRVQIANTTGRIRVRVMNNGTATVWLAFGDGTVSTAATTGIPLGPGTSDVWTIDAPAASPLYAAAIAAGATGSVYFSPGAGA
jgi:hypothetical protein